MFSFNFRNSIRLLLLFKFLSVRLVRWLNAAVFGAPFKIGQVCKVSSDLFDCFYQYGVAHSGQIVILADRGSAVRQFRLLATRWNWMESSKFCSVDTWTFDGLKREWKRCKWKDWAIGMRTGENAMKTAASPMRLPAHYVTGGPFIAGMRDKVWCAGASSAALFFTIFLFYGPDQSLRIK